MIYKFQKIIYQWYNIYLPVVKVQEGMFKLATVEQCFCLDEYGLDVVLVLPQNPLGGVPCHCPVTQQAVDLGRSLPDLLRLRVDVH